MPNKQTPNMTTIELSTGTLLVVDVQDSAKEFCIVPIVSRDSTQMLYFNDKYGHDGKCEKVLPPGHWQLLGHPSEITGEVWGKVVERYGIVGWRNYKVESQYEELLKQSPLESGLSLCAAHGIKETDVLLFKAKNS